MICKFWNNYRLTGYNQTEQGNPMLSSPALPQWDVILEWTIKTRKLIFLQTTKPIQMTLVLQVLICECVCMYFNAILSSVWLFVTFTTKIHKCSITTGLPHITPFIWPQSLTSGNHKSVLHLCNFVVLRILYKYKHILYNLLRLAFLI